MMFYRLLLLGSVCFSPMLMAASFDCQKARAPIEHAICDHADLDAADSVLSQRYKELRQSLDQSARQQLKQSQRQWLKQRLKQCTVDDISCLVAMYQTRIAELESKLGIHSVGSLSVQATGTGVQDFVPQGYQILDVTEGDLNRDAYKDVVLILQSEQTEDRPLLLLTRNPNQRLQLAARNDDVVLCKTCGGVFGDPYHRTVINKGYFTIEHYGGSSWKWTKYITFKYTKKLDNWLVHKVTDQSFHASDPDNVETQTQKDFGTRLFQDYRNEY